MKFEKLRDFALSLPETTESPHFEKTSFRVGGKIFLTFDQTQHFICIKLTETSQDIFSLYDPTVIFPVPNKWGKKGWTLAKIDLIPDKMVKDLIKDAYLTVAPLKMREMMP